METNDNIKQVFNQEGFVIINKIFSNTEVETITHIIENASSDTSAFRKTKDLFAIRQFLQEVPDIITHLLTTRFLETITKLFGNEYFIVKSIYFDKPPTSNWFVSYHQDLTIAVDKKITVPGFDLWTVKDNHFAVQPPVAILQQNFTVRIHLDDTDENSGALKVIPASHIKGIVRQESLHLEKETETICEVEKGGIMLMKPLLFHSSGRTTNANRRRVIHIECSKSQLPAGLQWSELIHLNNQHQLQ